MATTLEVYFCKKSGTTVELIKSDGIQPLAKHNEDDNSIVYHGNTLDFVYAKTPENAETGFEKHVPIAEFNGEQLVVKVGDVMHPMTNEHLIEWVTIVYDNFVQHGNFNSEQTPQITFHVGNAAKIDVYAYCNLHGLWKTTITK